MKKMINKTHIEGLVYENELKLNVAGPTAKNPGMEYINGKISILTGENNVVEVQLYEAALTSKGATNGKFATAKSLLEAKTIMTDGQDLATAIRIDSAISLNEWYKQDQLVSTPRNFGGFVHIIPKVGSPSATFETDILIVNTTPEMVKGQDEEMVESGRLVINGYIFDFANKIMPVKFIVENELGVKFFEGMEPNTFTKVWGNQVSSTIKSTRVEESAFGESKVVESEFTRREWIATGAMKEAYADETMLTAQDIQTALANRNIYLAETKKRSEDRQNQRNSNTGTGFGTAKTGAANPLGGLNIGTGGFNF